MRDYLHVIDLAKGHLLALTALADDSKVFDNCPTPARFKAYNLGKGKGLSVLQIVEAMRKATGFDYKYEIIGRRSVVFFCRFVSVANDGSSDGETSRTSRLTPPSPRKSSGSTQRKISRQCGGICGIGRRRTRKGTTPCSLRLPSLLQPSKRLRSQNSLYLPSPLSLRRSQWRPKHSQVCRNGQCTVHSVHTRSPIQS